MKPHIPLLTFLHHWQYVSFSKGIAQDSVALKRPPISSFKTEPVSHYSWPMKSRLLLSKSFIFSLSFLVVWNLHCFHSVSRMVLEKVNPILTCAAIVIQKTETSFVIDQPCLSSSSLVALDLPPNKGTSFLICSRTASYKWLFHWKNIFRPENRISQDKFDHYNLII